MPSVGFGLRSGLYCWPDLVALVPPLASWPRQSTRLRGEPACMIRMWRPKLRRIHATILGRRDHLSAARPAARHAVDA